MPSTAYSSTGAPTRCRGMGELPRTRRMPSGSGGTRTITSKRTSQTATGYRLETFGPDWNYDDGFPDFTAAAWDPREWVDLFADAGATYFVLTTKHHDGFALFDAGETSNRSSINYGPKRDIAQELFDAAATYQPTLKRGTYFSLPEWYNPDFGPYGFVQYDTVSSTSWVGIPALNPFTNLTEPYTGKLPIGDFVEDLMYPQMKTLAYKYGSDISKWFQQGCHPSASSKGTYHMPRRFHRATWSERCR